MILFSTFVSWNLIIFSNYKLYYMAKFHFLFLLQLKGDKIHMYKNYEWNIIEMSMIRHFSITSLKYQKYISVWAKYTQYSLIWRHFQDRENEGNFLWFDSSKFLDLKSTKIDWSNLWFSSRLKIVALMVIKVK